MCGGGDPEVKETPEQKELARIAVERWEKYQQMYKPVEQQYFDHVDNLATPEASERAGGVAAVNVESAFADAIQTDIAQMTTEGTGVDPSSGKFQSAIADHTQRKGAARAENINRSMQAVDDAHIGGLQNIVAKGNNQAGEAIAGFGDVARRSSDEARSQAINDSNQSQSTAGAVGTLAGAGYGAYRNSSQESANV